MGDDQSGFYNKVVFNNTTNNENEATDEKKKKKKTDGKKSMSSEEGEAQQLVSKKERQKLKRKAKKEAAKERKRLKRAQEEEAEGVDNNDGMKEGDAKTSAVVANIDESTLQQQQQQQQQQQEEVEQLQTTWSISAPGITLHSTLSTGLHSLNYTYPTPIQSATLPAAIIGRRDIVGAAPTGSGKTLSFGLPILQYLLDHYDNDDNGDDASSREQQQHPKQKKKLPLQALILTPTRELAMQVTEELRRVSCNNIPIGTIVGGFAEVKQKRILDKTRPPILVATPGRLWELVSYFL